MGAVQAAGAPYMGTGLFKFTDKLARVTADLQVDLHINQGG